MALLEIKNLSFTYAGASAPTLNGVELSVEEGDFVLLCGHSGCGKSTLLRLLKASLSPHGKKEGVILLDGKPSEEWSERTAAFDVGYVMQNPDGQIVTDKVWHELAFALESQGVSSGEIRRRVAEICGFFGIGSLFHSATAELSGGQKQLVNLAAVMVSCPRVLVLDEPTAQLDPIAASSFLESLKKLNRELGMTVIIAEHRLDEVYPMATKVAVMSEKRIAMVSTPAMVAEKLRSLADVSSMFRALPAPIRLYHALQEEGLCPITVREGRLFLTSRYGNDVSTLVRDTESYQGRSVALAVKNGYFRYEKNTPDILKGLSLSVYTGEFMAIVGANGAGKTTLLRVLAGLKRLYSGKVIRMTDSKEKKETLRHAGIALLPQNPLTLFVRTTLKDDLLEACDLMGYPKAERKDAVLRMAEELEITSLLAQHPYDLSGGEAQKAALAKLLLMKPEIILLDEPTKGLDPYAKEMLGKLLSRLTQEGKTVVAVTHDVVFASEYAHRAAMYFDGVIVSCEPCSAFFAENTYYTTPISRMSKPYYTNAVTFDDLVTLCRLNGRKEDRHG